MRFDGRVAFITGASGRIGAAVARMLHDAGASVGLASRRGDDLGLERGLGLACDVRDADAVDAAVTATADRFGRLDIVVANAGVGAYGPFLDLSREHLEEMIDTNLKGTLRRAAPLAGERRGRRDHACLGGRSPRAAVRGRLLRVEVRAGRLHPGTRPRAPGERRPLHERLPGRRRHRLRAGGRPRSHRILETAIRPMTETSWG